MSELVAEIKRLKEEKNAVILAHNYQKAEIQDIADFTGDSLKLSYQAAEAKENLIVFCGVDFMAESAAVLAQDKKVLLPVRDAFCPMAEMITAQELLAKKKEYPEATVICYVNSSAAVKAVSDVCCTSSNAVEVAQKVAGEQLLFVPDQNLGQYVQQQVDKEVILWDGYCRTHHRVSAKQAQIVRERNPDTAILVHPECRPEVVEQADFVGSTSQILAEANKSTAKELIIGTEMGILHKLEQENPEQAFFLLDQALICQNMKKISLADLATALKNEEYLIEVEPEIAKKAKVALDKMFALTS